MNLKKDNVGCVFLPNMPEMPIAFLGMLEVGLIPSPVNPIGTSGIKNSIRYGSVFFSLIPSTSYSKNGILDELAKQVNGSKAKFIITIPSLLETVRAAQKKAATLEHIIIVSDEAYEGCHSFFEMLKVDNKGTNYLKGSDIDAETQVALLPFSSGTTGLPKGVMLSTSNICTNIAQYCQPGYYPPLSFENGREQERFIGVLPFFHIYGFSLTMASSLYLGCHTVCVPKFDPDVFVNTIQQHKVD